MPHRVFDPLQTSGPVKLLCKKESTGVQFLCYVLMMANRDAHHRKSEEITIVLIARIIILILRGKIDFKHEWAGQAEKKQRVWK